MDEFPMPNLANRQNIYRPERRGTVGQYNDYYECEINTEKLRITIKSLLCGVMDKTNFRTFENVNKHHQYSEMRLFLSMTNMTITFSNVFISGKKP